MIHVALHLAPKKTFDFAFNLLLRYARIAAFRKNIFCSLSDDAGCAITILTDTNTETLLIGAMLWSSICNMFTTCSTIQNSNFHKYLYYRINWYDNITIARIYLRKIYVRRCIERMSVSLDSDSFQYHRYRAIRNFNVKVGRNEREISLVTDVSRCFSYRRVRRRTEILDVYPWLRISWDP